MSGSDPHSQLFEALSHPHRRVALYYLDDHEEASLSSLAECLAGWTQSGPGSQAVTDDIDEIRLTLHHQHLPTLAAAGLVDYDADERTVEFRGLPDGGEEVLALAVSADTGTVRDAEGEPGDGASLTVEVDDADGR